MPPPRGTLDACIAIKKQVRDFFARGHKSGNKIYEDLPIVPDEKFYKRDQDAAESRTHRLKNPGRISSSPNCCERCPSTTDRGTVARWRP